MFEMGQNIFKNLLTRKATRRYPRFTRKNFENVRGRIFNDILSCTFCGTCAAKCPSQSIFVERKAAVWSHDPNSCIYCGLCAQSCPSGSLRQEGQYGKPVRKKELLVLKGEIKKKASEGENLSSD